VKCKLASTQLQLRDVDISSYSTCLLISTAHRRQLPKIN